MPKLQYKFDPIEKYSAEIPKSRVDRALREVRDYVKNEVLSYVGAARSPVTGHKFEGLSPKYKKFKREHSSSATANLELSGAMLDDFDVKILADGTLSVEVSGSKLSVDKARGHNQHSGDEHEYLPVRRFIPEDDEGFTSRIEQGIKKIVRSYE